jgi:methionyl-tRNA formyltransferase
MLNFVECKIASDETGGSLQNKMSAIGPPALLHTLEKIARGKRAPVKQDSALSTYAAKLTKDEAFLDWSTPAERLSRKILALNPSQVACTTLNNEHIRIWHAEPSVACEGVIPGTIISTSNDGIQVGTGQGSLLITQLQLPGKNRLQASEVLRSKAVYFSPGNIFGKKADDQ